MARYGQAMKDRVLDAETTRQGGLASLGASERARATAQPFANLRELLKSR